MKNRWQILSSVVAITFIATSAVASPIYLNADHTQYFDFNFSVNSSVVLVPGQTGFVMATLENTGTEAVTFQEYDSSNPIGGYGWDFYLPGLALGGGGGVTRGDLGYTTRFGYEFGQVSTVTAGTGPSFSHLSNVTINAGDSLTFTLYSMLIDPSVSEGTSGTLESAIQMYFGSPIFAGFWSDRYIIDITAGNAYGLGSMQQVGLDNFQFSPRVPTVPTPIGLPLFLFGLLGLGLIGRRRKRPALNMQSHQGEIEN